MEHRAPTSAPDAPDGTRGATDSVPKLHFGLYLPHNLVILPRARIQSPDLSSSVGSLGSFLSSMTQSGRKSQEIGSNLISSLSPRDTVTRFPASLDRILCSKLHSVSTQPSIRLTSNLGAALAFED